MPTVPCRRPQSFLWHRSEIRDLLSPSGRAPRVGGVSLASRSPTSRCSDRRQSTRDEYKARMETGRRRFRIGGFPSEPGQFMGTGRICRHGRRSVLCHSPSLSAGRGGITHAAEVHPRWVRARRSSRRWDGGTSGCCAPPGPGGRPNPR